MKIYFKLIVLIVFFIGISFNTSHGNNDVKLLAEALNGGVIESVNIEISIEDNFSASGNLTAIIKNLNNFEKMSKLLEKGNRQIKRQENKLAVKGGKLGKLVFGANKDNYFIKASASIKDLKVLNKILSKREPVNVSISATEKEFSISASPKPILYLLAPFLSDLKIRINYPGKLLNNNGDMVKENSIYWNRSFTIPDLNFSFIKEDQ